MQRDAMGLGGRGSGQGQAGAAAAAAAHEPALRGSGASGRATAAHEDVAPQGEPAELTRERTPGPAPPGQQQPPPPLAAAAAGGPGQLPQPQTPPAAVAANEPQPRQPHPPAPPAHARPQFKRDTTQQLPVYTLVNAGAASGTVAIVDAGQLPGGAASGAASVDACTVRLRGAEPLSILGTTGGGGSGSDLHPQYHVASPGAVAAVVQAAVPGCPAALAARVFSRVLSDPRFKLAPEHRAGHDKRINIYFSGDAAVAGRAGGADSGQTGGDRLPWHEHGTRGAAALPGGAGRGSVMPDAMRGQWQIQMCMTISPYGSRHVGSRVVPPAVPALVAKARRLVAKAAKAMASAVGAAGPSEVPTSAAAPLGRVVVVQLPPVAVHVMGDVGSGRQRMHAADGGGHVQHAAHAPGFFDPCPPDNTMSVMQQFLVEAGSEAEAVALGAAAAALAVQAEQEAGELLGPVGPLPETLPDAPLFTGRRAVGPPARALYRHERSLLSWGRVVRADAEQREELDELRGRRGFAFFVPELLESLFAAMFLRKVERHERRCREAADFTAGSAGDGPSLNVNISGGAGVGNIGSGAGASSGAGAGSGASAGSSAGAGNISSSTGAGHNTCGGGGGHPPPPAPSSGEAEDDAAAHAAWTALSADKRSALREVAAEARARQVAVDSELRAQGHANTALYAAAAAKGCADGGRRVPVGAHGKSTELLLRGAALGLLPKGVDAAWCADAHGEVTRMLQLYAEGGRGRGQGAQWAPTVGELWDAFLAAADAAMAALSASSNAAQWDAAAAQAAAAAADAADAVVEEAGADGSYDGGGSGDDASNDSGSSRGGGGGSAGLGSGMAASMGAARRAGAVAAAQVGLGPDLAEAVAGALLGIAVAASAASTDEREIRSLLAAVAVPLHMSEGQKAAVRGLWTSVSASRSAQEGSAVGLAAADARRKAKGPFVLAKGMTAVPNADDVAAYTTKRVDPATGESVVVSLAPEEALEEAKSALSNGGFATGGPAAPGRVGNAVAEVLLAQDRASGRAGGRMPVGSAAAAIPAAAAVVAEAGGPVAPSGGGLPAAAAVLRAGAHMRVKARAMGDTSPAVAKRINDAIQFTPGEVVAIAEGVAARQAVRDIYERVAAEASAAAGVGEQPTTARAAADKERVCQAINAMVNAAFPVGHAEPPKERTLKARQLFESKVLSGMQARVQASGGGGRAAEAVAAAAAATDSLLAGVLAVRAAKKPRAPKRQRASNDGGSSGGGGGGGCEDSGAGATG